MCLDQTLVAAALAGRENGSKPLRGCQAVMANHATVWLVETGWVAEVGSRGPEAARGRGGRRTAWGSEDGALGAVCCGRSLSSGMRVRRVTSPPGTGAYEGGLWGERAGDGQ